MDKCACDGILHIKMYTSICMHTRRYMNTYANTHMNVHSCMYIYIYIYLSYMCIHTIMNLNST